MDISNACKGIQGVAGPAARFAKKCLRNILESADTIMRSLPPFNCQGKTRTTVATAIARELSAFIWSIDRKLQEANV